MRQMPCSACDINELRASLFQETNPLKARKDWTRLFRISKSEIQLDALINSNKELALINEVEHEGIKLSRSNRNADLEKINSASLFDKKNFLIPEVSEHRRKLLKELK